MTQNIVIQIGQAGNQIGARFWEDALLEHTALPRTHRGSSSKSPLVFDDAFATFFRNVDTRTTPPTDIFAPSEVAALKARAVLIDMEEGVVNELLKGPMRDVFDTSQLLTSVSGSGNNWAVGYETYGKQYREQISECVRKAAEKCDCLQSFLVLHSVGGGTGSGQSFSFAFLLIFVLFLND